MLFFKLVWLAYLLISSVKIDCIIFSTRSHYAESTPNSALRQKRGQNLAQPKQFRQWFQAQSPHNPVKLGRGRTSFASDYTVCFSVVTTILNLAFMHDKYIDAYPDPWIFFHTKQPLKPFLRAVSSKFLPMKTILFILFSLGPHSLPGQPSKVECTAWKSWKNVKIYIWVSDTIGLC